MKKTLYIAIIVIALGGAAIMGYMAFMGGDSGGVETVVVNDEAASYNILPEGKTLDFNTLKEFNKDGRLFPYPVVSPAEVGQVLGNIIE